MENQLYIDALANALGQELSLDQNGTLVLSIDDVPLLIQERAGHFHLQMPIGGITPVDKLAVMTELLSANFLLHKTGGGALSYNADANTVFLEYPITTAQLDADGFVSGVEDFTHMADAWMAKLEEMNTATEARVAKAMDELEAEFARDAYEGDYEGDSDEDGSDALDAPEGNDMLDAPRTAYLRI